MPEDSFKASRRALLKGSLAGAACLSVSSIAQEAKGASAACHVGFDFATYTVNDKAVAVAADEHTLILNYYIGDSYVVGNSNQESRYLLCVDHIHPIESGTLPAKNTITDIYVFNQANNELLFWKKMSSGEPYPASMFVVTAQQHRSQLKITVVARCSLHGYYGVNYSLPVAPPNYSTAVAPYDGTKFCAGVPLARPYLAPSASGGQGDMGVLHRPNIIVQSDTLVRGFLGGSLNGSGKHPRFADNHYVMGGALFDQNGNLISAPQTVIYSTAGNHEVVFPVASLAATKVTLLRMVMFDTLQGRLMGFLDI